MTDYIQRELHHSIANALRTMPVVAITGMRQTGKTTFLRNDPLFKKHRYLTLDDFSSLQTALAQPESVIPSEGFIAIDEAQKAPELLTVIKQAVDRKRVAGRFVLSGSANFALMQRVSESLAGRAVHLVLYPFSRRELTFSTETKPVIVQLIMGNFDAISGTRKAINENEIHRGGMPSVRDLPAADASVWFRGFEQTYVERDIRDLARIDDVLGFRDVVRLAACRTGQILNLSQLSRDTRLSVATTTRYLTLAETSFLFRRLPPFLRNRSSRLIKSPKLYLTDSGLASHLAGVETLDNDEPMRGALFETFLLQNVSSILEAHLPDACISYWHVQGRHEVDFIVEYKRTCLALEVKAATRWTDRDLSSLKVFLDQTPQCKAGLLVYNGTQTAQLGERLWAVPMATVIA